MSDRADLSRAESDYKIKILLPRWEPGDEAPQDLSEAWDRLSLALCSHERDHADFARKNFLKVGQAIREAALQNPLLSPLEADAIGMRELEKIRQLDREYDRRTKHGKTQGIVW